MVPYGRPGERSNPRQDGRRQQPAITKPTPCNLVANLYKYTGKQLIMCRYAVTFTPEVSKQDVFGRFMRMAEQNNFKEQFAFDGNATLVSLKQFPDCEFRSPMRDGELVCRVEYKGSCSMDPAAGNYELVASSLEVLYKHHQRLHFYVSRRTLFSPSARAEPIGAAIEVVPGLSACIKQTRLGLCLNLDMAYTAFFKARTLLEFMQEVSGRSSASLEFDRAFYTGFEKLLKTIRLVTNHRERPFAFKPSGLLMKAAHEVTFETEDGPLSVAEYFSKVYKPLRYPHLPLVAVKRRSGDVFMPMEVLDVVPMQRCMRRLDEAECAQMIRIAATRPAERFRLISQKASELSALSNETLKQFGICFNNQMLNCKGVVLPPPEMLFKDGRGVRAANGGWNLAGVAAVSGSEAREWKIFVFRDNNRVSSDQLRDFTAQAAKYGVVFGRPTTEVVRSVDEFFSAKKAFFNLVVLPDRGAQRYEEIKRVAETYDSCYTQCLLAQNLRKLSNPAFVGNLLLKINTKLGGRNWTLRNPILSDKETILIGIDIEHPAPGDMRSPSIVGIVASMDYDFVTYSTAVKQQEHRQEIVTTLQGTVRDMLKRHYASTRKKPRRIIVFRDGVGESMFDAVFAAEIESVRAACSELSASYKPEINFIVAQKRHSIRFSAEGRNPMPGTVVEELGQTLGREVLDFYLVSHTAIQGTAKPVRYLVLLNESGFSLTDVYTTVYSLCHLYMRATKSVSLVPPVYYAHLAAARGKCYLEENADGVLLMRNCHAVFEKTLFFI